MTLARSEAPLGKAEVWPGLIDYAREHGIVIDTVYAHKVDWMEEHKGVCFCSWDSGRVCPCGNIEEDFELYNGQCLCGLLLTPKKLIQKQNYDKRKKENAKKKKELDKG